MQAALRISFLLAMQSVLTYAAVTLVCPLLDPLAAIAGCSRVTPSTITSTMTTTLTSVSTTIITETTTEETTSTQATCPASTPLAIVSLFESDVSEKCRNLLGTVDAQKPIRPLGGTACSNIYEAVDGSDTMTFMSFTAELDNYCNYGTDATSCKLVAYSADMCGGNQVGEYPFALSQYRPIDGRVGCTTFPAGARSFGISCAAGPGCPAMAARFRS